MFDGLQSILTKGGPASALIFYGLPIWGILVFLICFRQRQVLNQWLETVLAEHHSATDCEPAVAQFRSGFTFFTGGIFGAIVLGVWWLVAFASLIWTPSALVDIMRIDDPAYLNTLQGEPTTIQLMRQHSSGLITRSLVGITGIPALMITLLALDQMVFRPRTRLPEVLRRRLAKLNPGAPESLAVADGIGVRAQGRWSWMAASFTWVWLLFKGLPIHGVVVLVVQVLVGIGLGVLATLGIGASSPIPSLEFEVTVWRMFWQPALGALLNLGPSLILMLVIGMKAPGWLAKTERKRMGP